MNKYIVYSKGNGYYTGKKYMCKKAFDDVEYYPIFTDNIDKAKKYTSEKRAINFINKFSEINPFNYEWKVEELKDEIYSKC